MCARVSVCVRIRVHVYVRARARVRVCVVYVGTCHRYHPRRSPRFQRPSTRRRSGRNAVSSQSRAVSASNQRHASPELRRSFFPAASLINDVRDQSNCGEYPAMRRSAAVSHASSSSLSARVVARAVRCGRVLLGLLRRRGGLRPHVHCDQRLDRTATFGARPLLLRVNQRVCAGPTETLPHDVGNFVRPSSADDEVIPERCALGATAGCLSVRGSTSKTAAS
jgi:hypothetical protein